MPLKVVTDGLVEVTINHSRCSNARYGAYLRSLMYGGKQKVCGITTRITVPADAAVRVGLTTRVEVETAKLAAKLAMSVGAPC